MKLETTFIYLFFHQVAVIDSCASTTAVWELDDKNYEDDDLSSHHHYPHHHQWHNHHL